VTIVAVKEDAQPHQFGLVYFDEHEWPKEGYRLLKRVTGCTKADLERS
jgi:hypothetical protein